MSSTNNEQSSFDGSNAQSLDGAATQPEYGAPERVADLVRDAAQDAASASERKAEAFYSEASHAATETSNAIDDAADALEKSGHEKLSRAAEAISDRVRTVSNYLEEHKLEDVLGDARRLVQRNPGVFIAGGVALGFVLSRLLAASTTETKRPRRNA